ncbi:phage terminase large subunit [uncultured Halomonas sp.]|uniref:phage terminase large subunit n=1 Tax=uncultured Halomonas sp. TaxID=173971 RepID=UPI002603522F|nr:phage terminase large subunit [uncultured Halomonas sp.]
MNLKDRYRRLLVLQELYSDFVPFLTLCMEFLGFKSTEIQRDIAEYLQHGPHYLMVQAQRGQAKSTITAIFAVWCLIHDPKYRVLVVSAGGTQANEVATLITRLILHMPELACLRPDRNRGDRVSVEAFDVYGELKGVDKSPSVACIGITGNLPGKRADLLIADDIESPKNGRTPGQREILLQLTREFSSICQTGRIVYLGTPQTDSSIYNTLPARGFAIRIWPGRYPTKDQIEHYGAHLAPLIVRRLKANPLLAEGGGLLADQGQPTDPVLQNEEFLQKKEQDQGPASFQLQYMLNTKLADADRYPLKPIHLVVMNLNERLPMEVYRGTLATDKRKFQIGSIEFEVMCATGVSEDHAEPQGRCFYVDPAGGGKNGDETAYAVVDFLNGNLYVRAVGGVPGGYSQEVMHKLAKLVEKYKPTVVKVEQNMGYGAFIQSWQPILRKVYQGGLEDDWASGQKETRIIDTLEPIMARGSLILDESVLTSDWPSTSAQPSHKRQLYTLAHQLSTITRDRGSLVHDDRLDALASACKHWLDALAVDQTKELAKKRAQEHKAWVKDPLQHSRYEAPSRRGRSFPNAKRRK